jgi:predicted ester cyclase
MTTEENKAVVRRFNDEVWNTGNLAIIDELFATTWVGHDLPPGLAPGREGLKQMVGAFRAAFSDIRATVDDQIAEGDEVAWRWTFQGTHSGEFMGIPPTGKTITLTGISIDRLAGGKFVERWDSADTLGMMQQFGVISAPGQAGP